METEHAECIEKQHRGYRKATPDCNGLKKKNLGFQQLQK